MRRSAGAAVTATVCAMLLLQTVPAMGEVAAPPEVVVLGDSYVSGEGLPAASGECGRAPDAWGVVVGRSLGDPEPQNLACSGAEVADVLLGDETGAAQVDAVDGPADVVVLLVGGNEIGFASLVAGCLDVDGEVDPDAFEGGATGSAWSDLVGSGQRTLGCDADPDDLLDDLDGLLATDRFPLGSGESGGLDAVLVEIAERALVDGGTLVVATYPALFDLPAAWPARYGRRCHGVLASDAAAFVEVTTRLGEVLTTAGAAAADQLGDRAAVVVVDVGAVARGAAPGPDGVTESHGLCGPGTAWVNGLTLVEGGVDVAAASSALLGGGPFDLAALGARPTASFHPNTAGHAGIAAVVEDALGQAIDG